MTPKPAYAALPKYVECSFSNLHGSIPKAERQILIGLAATVAVTGILSPVLSSQVLGGIALIGITVNLLYYSNVTKPAQEKAVQEYYNFAKKCPDRGVGPFFHNGRLTWASDRFATINPKAIEAIGGLKALHNACVLRLA